jgi:hypothetical protein
MRALSPGPARPRRRLNPFVRRADEAIHRVIELVVGFSVIGHFIYAMGTGSISGKFRLYTRREHPFSFWATVLIAFGIGIVFMFGQVSWRN